MNGHAGYQVIYGGGVTEVRIPTTTQHGRPTVRVLRFAGRELPPYVGLDAAAGSAAPTEEGS